MKLRPFELVLVTVFGLIGLFALLLLSTYKPGKTPATIAFNGPVIIWGTLDANVINAQLAPLIKADKAYLSIEYVQKDPNTIDNDLLNALAENRGPDLIFVPSDKLTSYRSKLRPFSYEQFPIRDFRNLYIDGAEIFALNDGVYAYPIAVDPLVMYWNRQALSNKNILTAPATWESVVTDIVPKLIERDVSQRTILRSPIAFGVYSNEAHGGDIVSMLALQSGSLGITEGGEGRYNMLLNQSTNVGQQPLGSALSFYTSFANPNNSLYSWNRSFALDRDAFLSEDLALYFGRGSEARMIASKNPNLNFDIAEVPQGQTATIRRTFGTFYGLALLRSAHNVQGAKIALQILGAADFAGTYAASLGMAPVSRTTLAAGSNDTYGRIIYTSAISARALLTPAPAKVDMVLGGVVEDILANRRQATDAASDAVGRLSQSY